MKIVFVDTVCPKAYDSESLEREAMGGTEATVIRVAEGLATRGHEVSVYQHKRKELFTSPIGTRYIDSLAGCEKSDISVTVRSPNAACDLADSWKRPRHYLWLHDWIASPTNMGSTSAANGSRQMTAYVDLAYDLDVRNVTTICVSQTHLIETHAVRLDYTVARKPCTYIYNPVADYCKPSGRAIDGNKLVFFSSPHKGLDRTLYLFSLLRELHPELRLYVANPGYMPNMKILHSGEGVEILDPMPHRDMMDILADAFCVFYPNTVFPETFGLVLAEANAMNVPVLCHDFGAAGEVLSRSQLQAVNCAHDNTVLGVFDRWKELGRPAVTGKNYYNIYSVINTWEHLFHANITR